MCEAKGLSQRRACRLTGLSLSTCRYEAHRPAADAHLSGRITELALERRRFGYRRIWQLLRREGLHVNHKRVYRLYHLSGLGVKRRRRRKGLATERLPLLRPAAPNLTWSMDWHCCKVSDEAAFCLIQRPYISKTLLTRRISPRGSP